MVSRADTSCKPRSSGPCVDSLTADIIPLNGQDPALLLTVHSYLLLLYSCIRPSGHPEVHVEADGLFLSLPGFWPAPPLSKSTEPSEEVHDGDPAPLLIGPIPLIGVGGQPCLDWRLSFACKVPLLASSGRDGSGGGSRPSECEPGIMDRE